MTYLLASIKIIGGPGSLGLFVAAVLAGVLVRWLWPAGRRVLAWALGALITLYLVLALPVVALAIVNALPRNPTPDPRDVRAIQALVVFDGDNRTGRQRRTHQLLRQVSPHEVWVLGPDFLLGDVRVALAPGTVLHHDATTWNTSAQVSRVRQIANTWPLMSTAVIASRIQMPRIAALFEAADTSVLLVPSDLDREPVASGAVAMLPSFSALTASRDAIYEHAALAWYRWRGDIR